MASLLQLTVVCVCVLLSLIIISFIFFVIFIVCTTIIKGESRLLCLDAVLMKQQLRRVLTIAMAFSNVHLCN